MASLAEPQRRRLYRFVIASEAAVSKDDAVRALGIARSVATFHLDRLVADGLLVAEYRRLSGREGPGAGRPAKLYRRADREIAVTLPERRYRLAADLLAAAVSAAMSTGAALEKALTQAARKQGRQLAAAVIDRAAPHASRRALVDATIAVLEAHGYEPRRAKGEIVMANCPFHALVDQHRELVCGMNLDLLAGLAAALPHPVVSTRLQPSDTTCCVRLTTRN